MNTHSASTFKALTLLCTISLSSLSFAAAPAPQARPSLEDQLAILEAMEDTEIVCKVVPTSQDYAEQSLAHYKRIFQEQNSSYAKEFTKQEAQHFRLSHQYWAIEKEIDGCGDHERRNHLQAQQHEIIAKYAISAAESQKYANSLRSGNMMPLDAYNYQGKQSNVFQCHTSLLLAQKEAEKMQLQQEKNQLQQEKQALLVENQNLRNFNDGPQIEGGGQQIDVSAVASQAGRHGLAEEEGVPNVPGGPKQVIKRRGSF
jgi:hypothetical protein